LQLAAPILTYIDEENEEEGRQQLQRRGPVVAPGEEDVLPEQCLELLAKQPPPCGTRHYRDGSGLADAGVALHGRGSPDLLQRKAPVQVKLRAVRVERINP
jgi:hypothetical protein